MLENILFVCTMNQERSKTAEDMYSDDSRINVRSAGTAPYCARRISGEIIRWADYIFVMQKAHKRYIENNFSDSLDDVRILCMYIPDVYGYKDRELVSIIRSRFERYLKRIQK
jgi:predicted protein tyrosine phosphatase